ncbi:MAG: hypothetical protein MUC62_08790 [Candidatus Thermoplasmatota archaeon]|nr:hypothetical protein [Candidatus Thermoplasmatota archaeon]
MMDRGCLFAVLLSTALLLCIGCVELPGSEEEDDDDTAQLSKDYTGTLDITYSRDFPSFEATSQAFVRISKDGKVGITPGTPAIYDADDILQIEGGQMRQRETGTLSLSGGSGVVIIRGVDEFVALSIDTKIAGEQETFGWDEQTMSWISLATVPFDLEDPIEPPVEFNIFNATAGDGLAFTTRSPQISGYVTYEWRLVLIPSIK